MTIQTIHGPTHEEILRKVVAVPFSEEDGLLWMIILHTQKIQVRANDAGANGIKDQTPLWLAPLTQRGAAEILASLWPDREDPRAHYVYWYWQYNEKTPYECWASVPPALIPRIKEKMCALAKDPRIVAIAEDD